MNHPFSQEHLNILTSTCVMLIQAPDPSSLNQQYTANNYTPSVAINKYVATATELTSFSLNILRNGSLNASEDINASLNRLLRFMIDNAKGTLTYYIDKTRSLFFQEVDDAINSKTNIITIMMIVDPIVILILLMLFIPFILRVQTNLLRIYLHLCQFKDTDIRKWLEECNNSANHIKASITKMKKIYEAESFEVVIKTEEEKKTQENNAASKKLDEKVDSSPSKETPQEGINMTTDKSTEGALIKHTGEEDETAAMVASKEDIVSERKQKMFSRMTKEKTKEYLILLLGFTIYIGIFKTADALVFSSLCSDSSSQSYYFRLLIDREKYDAMGMFFFREELLENKIENFFDCINTNLILDPDATEFYVDSAFSSEMEYSQMRAMLTGSLSSLKDFLNLIDTPSFCSTIFTGTNITSITSFN